MKKDTNILNLSGDFFGACNMFQVQPLTALQFYISQTTVYFNLAKVEDKTISLASTIFDQCLRNNGRRRGKMDEYKRIAGIKYIKEVMKLIADNNNPVEKETKYKNVINKWYEEIQPSLPPKDIKTSDGLTVSLTKDFCILCDLFHCTPLKVLQHYVNHVSLPTYINSTDENDSIYATAFFLQYPPIIKRINAS